MSKESDAIERATQSLVEQIRHAAHHAAAPFQAGPDPNERATYNVPEAGRILGLGRNASYAAAARGEIPTIKIGHRLLVPRAALERLLAGDGASADSSTVQDLARPPAARR